MVFSRFSNIDTKAAQIILLEAGPTILPTASNNLSIYAKNTLEKLGVEVKCDTIVKNISDGLVETNTETIESETLKENFRIKHKIKPAESFLLLLPGSRQQEIDQHLLVYLSAAKQLQ